MHATFNFMGLQCAVPGFLFLLKKKVDDQNTKNLKLDFVLVTTLLTDSYSSNTRKNYKVRNNKRIIHVKNKTFKVLGNLKTATLINFLISRQY